MKKYVAFLLIPALAAAFCGCVAEVPPALSVAPAESGESSAEIAVSSEPAVSEELSLPLEDSSEEELPANDPLHLDHSNILSLKYGVCALEFYDENNDFSVRYYIADEDGKYEITALHLFIYVHEKILGFSGKNDIEKYGIEKFCAECKKHHGIVITV